MSPRTRRSRGRWAIGIAIAVAVMAVLAVGAELIARQVVPAMVRAAVVERLALPADHPVEVEVEGIVVPQVVAGVLDDVHVTSQDVTVGAFSGDVVAHGRAIPIRADAPADGGTAEVRMTTEQLRSLLATIDGFPADSVELEAPNVTAAAEVELLGAAIPLGITLEPSAADGQIVLTPVEGTVAGAAVTADGLRAQFGSLADPILQDRRLCIADLLPAAMTLQSIEVVGDELAARFDIAGGIIDDPALQQNGTC
jgi:hypothetical protein